MPIVSISIILMVALIAGAFGYFQAANRISLAESWLHNHQELHQWHSNIALSRRLMRAMLGKEKVRSPRLLRLLQRRFYLLLMIASASVVWAIGLLIHTVQTA